jgi:cupin 2 domain-containing protein
MQKQNIFTNIPSKLSKELFEDILKTDNLRIERILSNQHSSPEGFWYDQDQDEWVIVLQGSATLLFKGENQPIELSAGDYILIKAHQHHRVKWTAKDTVWLAVHWFPHKGIGY